MRVEYPGEFELPERYLGPHFLDCPISSADVESGFCYHRKFPPDRPSGGSSSPRILRRCQPFASRSAVSPESRTPWPPPRGADAIGLVFYAKSPRAVDIHRAREIVRALPPFVTSVGLFVNASRCELGEILDAVPLDLLQFHGDERAEDCEDIGDPT